MRVRNMAPAIRVPRSRGVSQNPNRTYRRDLNYASSWAIGERNALAPRSAFQYWSPRVGAGNVGSVQRRNATPRARIAPSGAILRPGSIRNDAGSR
jgi:hypothetical protein